MQHSIVYFSEVNLHKDKRLDADHYHPMHLYNLKKYKEWSQPLSEFIIHISGGATPLGAVYPEKGIPFLRVQNIMPNYISDSGIKYLSPSQNQEILRSQLKKDDVLLTITGVSYGKSTVVTDEFVSANINQHSVKMTIRNIVPYFLSTFLNCKYGYSQSTRHVVGITRPALDYSAIKSFLIPDLDRKFQETIASYCSQAEISRTDSKQRYSQAQTLLLSELGLANWQPKHRLTFVKNYSDTEQAGRIDADYFQPFYEEVNKKLQSAGYVFAKDICSEINYGTVPTSQYSEDNSGMPYIKGLNLKNLCVDTEKLDYITNTNGLPNKVFTKKGDIIISQMGTVGNCGVVSKEQENWAFASFTIRIRIADISKYNPYFVALYIENIAKPYYLMRNIAQASVRQNTDLPTIKQMPIPSLSFEKQQQISQKITESFNLRKQSKHLLKCAKRAVEIAIEQDEQTAIDWLENETKEIRR